MMRSGALAASCVLALVAFAGTAAGQTAVEYGAGAARAATTAGPAKKISGVFSNLDKALKSTMDQATPKDGAAGAAARSPAAKRKTAAKTIPPPAPPEKVTPPPPARTYEDPAGIQAGLAYDELLARFGPPSMEFATGPAAKTLSYLTKGGVVQVECVAGKVTSAGRS